MSSANNSKVSIPVRVLDVLKLTLVATENTNRPVSIPVRVLDVLKLHKAQHLYQKWNVFQSL